MEKILEEIKKERQRQDEKWGVQNHHPFKWCTILGEEFGEACQAAFDSDHYGANGIEQKYRKELIEVAAVALAAIENLDRNRDLAATTPEYFPNLNKKNFE